MIEPVDDMAGTILDDQVEFTLLELCRMCDVSARHISEIVDEGIIEPAGTSPMHWRFTGLMMRRVQVVLRLERDLEVNLPGAALIIELLEKKGSSRK